MFKKSRSPLKFFTGPHHITMIGRGIDVMLPEWGDLATRPAEELLKKIRDIHAHAVIRGIDESRDDLDIIMEVICMRHKHCTMGI